MRASLPSRGRHLLVEGGERSQRRPASPGKDRVERGEEDAQPGLPGQDREGTQKEGPSDPRRQG